MVALKDNPIGIDRPIQQLQQYLHDYLLGAWDLTEDKVAVYGRAYRNQTKDGGYVPEVFTGNPNYPAGKNEYRDAYHNDKYAVVTFFTPATDIDVSFSEGRNTVDISLIVSVNLSQLPTVNHRGDEEARQTVARFLYDGQLGFILTGIQTGIDNVYSEYSGYREARSIMHRDMHPLHCFRMDMTLTYDKSNCFTPLFAQSN